MSGVASEQHKWPADAEPVHPWEIQVRRDGSDTPLVSRLMTQDFAVIGRRTDCDVRLPGSSVAARHIYLQQLAGTLLAIDLGSPDFGRRTGVLGRPGRTFVDVVCPGESIRVGEYQVSATLIEANCIPLAVCPPLPQFSQPVACWELTNVKGDETVIRRHVRHALTLIGSGPLCRIRIAHASASSVHASLVWRGGELFVVDLCSRTGVRVNEKPVRKERLKEGDELSIGHCRGVIRYLSPAPAENGPCESDSATTPSESLSTPVIVPAIQKTASDSDRTLDEIELRAEQVPGPCDTSPATPLKPQYSEEFVLSLLAQFTAMQQQLIEQSHRLMTDVTTRLSLHPEIASQSVDEFSAGKELLAEVDAPSPANSAVEDQNSLAPGAEQAASAEADVHAWLNQRLAGLEPAPPGRLAQLWERLMGSG